VMWRRVRVNLSDLAGALHPEGIDPAFLNPDWKLFLDERMRIGLSRWRSSHDRGHLTMDDGLKMRKVRQEIDYWVEAHRQDAGEAGGSH
jgi:hypothetical protein